MEPKTIDQYFESARQLPLAMSMEEVQALVKIKGGNISGNQHQSWWNLKNFIFMTTAAVIITSAILFMNSSPQEEQEPLKQETIIPTTIKEEVEAKEMPTSKEQPATPIDTNKQSEVFSTSKQEEELIISPANMPMGLEEPLALFEGEDMGGILIPDPTPPTNIFELSDLDVNDDTDDEIEGTTKTVEKETAVNGAKWLVVNNYKGDITINTSDQDNIQLKAYITVSGANEEDTQKALKDLDVNLEHKGNKIEVVKTGWGLFDETCSCPSGNTKGKITTKKGEKIKIKKYNVDYVITVPKNMSLELKDNYGDIEVQNIDGDVKLNSFQGGITTGDIGGELTLKSRYGKVQVGNFKSGDATFFQSKVKLGEVQELELDAKYSNVDAVSIEKMKLIAFQSDIYMEKKSTKVTGNLKYGDLIVENNVKEIDLTVFQSKIEVEDVEELELEGSYTSLKANNINHMDIGSSFQNKYRIEELNNIKGGAKYSTFDIGSLKGSLDLTTFQGSIDVDKVESAFSQLDINSKYTPIDLGFTSDAKFKLDAQTSYTDVNYPEEAMTIDYENKEYHKLTLKGIYNSKNNKEPSLVNVVCFQGKLNIK